MVRLIHLDANDGVRAYHGAFAALDANLRVPHRNFERDVALFPFGGAGGKSAIGWECAHGKIIAVAGVDCAEYIALEPGCRDREWRRDLRLAGNRIRDFDFVQMNEGFIYG